ncbi:MAG: VWA domain-containing protein [Hoeflea sp.]|uniref:vWA domain-containing protein n=1 Tax=Hoeflea sp. TaxID=1940281 RepID=UPI00273210EF|nr:VWA domain-containing protein [Hoeflea sp.]MDP2119697.1 VWA domain-containing protein [Hoeflea sp.]
MFARSACSLALGLAIAASAAAFGPALAQANDRAIIVLDASGSMWGQIDGRTKIEIARDTLSDVLVTLPDTLDLGLIAYGHREKGACSDIEEIVAPGPGTRGDIAAAVKSLNPKGKTPIADSVKMAAESLRYTEEKATVIVVTDGIETCNADPCALASELEKLGVEFTAHVIGFGLTEDEGRQVACLAENTGGRYLQAANAEELAGALTQTVAAEPAAEPAPEPEPEPAPEPEPVALEKNLAFTAVLGEGGPALDADGKWEIFPVTGDAPSAQALDYGYDPTWRTKVPAGRYLVRVSRDMVAAETIVEARDDELLERELVLDGGWLRVSVLPDEAAEIDDSARFDIAASGREAGGYGEGRFLVPAGEVTVKVRLGQARAEESFAIAVGESLDKRIVAGIGVLAVEAVYAENGPAVEDGGYRVDVLSGKMSLDGTRADVEGGYGPGNKFKLPPGDYVLRLRLDAATAEQPVSVRQGEMTAVTVNLNAGVLNVKAPGAYRIEILPAKADIQGRRNAIEGAYTEELQMTLPPGEYLAVAIMSGDSDAEKKEAQTSVTAAERTEITIP